MSNLIVLIGSGWLALLLVLLFMKVGENKDKTHFLLQILLLGFILVCFIFIGKAALDEGDKDCDWVVVNSTVTNNVTSYTNDYVCEEATTTTATDFYKLTVWILRIIGIYMFCYFVYEVLVYFGYIGKRRNDDE